MDLAAQLLAEGQRTGALAPSAPGALPPGTEPGHRYAYRAEGRCGTAYVQADGRVTEKAKGGGRRHDWAERNAAALVWVHAPYSCEGCG